MKLYLQCDKNKTEPTFTKMDYLLRAAERLGMKDSVMKDPMIEDFIAVYNGEPNPEYVLNIDPCPHFIKGSKWTGIWEIDLMLDRVQTSLSNWVESDVVFLSNTFLQERLQVFEGNKVVLFQACDPEIHKRNKTIPQEYDFVFAGSMGMDIYRERERVYNLMREHFTFYSFGKGFPPHKYVDCLSRARVQFARSGNNEIQDSQVEQRFFESLAIGPVLKDYHPGLKQLGLVEGEDFFWYKNDKEMLEKMHALIDNPDFAKEMADKGRKKALLWHTYDHRLISILKFIKENEK